MCTAISVNVNNKNYFGRNLDYDRQFGQKIVITPRNYTFRFSDGTVVENHYSIIGTAVVMDDYPLYFDAVNETGLCIAGLNFPDNAVYFDENESKINVASFELIPYLLSLCQNISQAKKILEKINITKKAFCAELSPTPLHWLISDKERSIVLEQTNEGIKLFENPVGVLTNSPPFEHHIVNLNNYMMLSHKKPRNDFCQKLNLKPYSFGMGALGLPGDLSSMSRFVRASFVKLNTDFGESEIETVNRFFHVLYCVYQQKGCVETYDGYEYTLYSCCCDTSSGIYYYTTYNNFKVNGIVMHKENLDSRELIQYDFLVNEEFNVQNS